MNSLELRELEAFLVLAEELHFGRTGERMYLSQSRVSQLLRSLERRIGTLLVERTSRTVRLTPMGAQFLDELRPAYAALHAMVDGARARARGMTGRLRIGFQGASTTPLMCALERFEHENPECPTDLVEIPLADPFGAVRRHEIDAAAVLLPMGETDLVLGQVFSEQQQTLALPSSHPLARRSSLSVEELAAFALIGVHGPAPEYWQRSYTLNLTPRGTPINAGPNVTTLEEGLALVATGRGAMLLCQPTAEYHRRPSVTFVPVTGLATSRLGLIWHRSQETPRVRAFAKALAAAA